MNWLETTSLDADGVLLILPHRYPFLFVDRVLEIHTSKPLTPGMAEADIRDARKGSYARTLKNVTANEVQFLGHFPGRPIFPGVLTLEVMAQSAAFVAVPFLAALNGGKLPKLDVALAGFDDVRFRRMIRPGDQLEVRVTAEGVRGNIWSFSGEVLVEQKSAAEGRFMAQVQGQGEH